jgi:hypothetical protein
LGDYHFVEFLVDPGIPPGQFKPLEGVGSRYDVAINRVGLQLFNGGDQYRDLMPRRVMLPMEPERFASGDTPFSDAVNRYSFTGWSDLSGGAGQAMRDRPSSDPTRYHHSQGINPFATPGEISLLPETEKAADLDGKPRLYQAGGKLYGVDVDSDEILVWTDPDTAPVSVTGPTGIIDVASDGYLLYVATTGGIYRGDDTGFSLWSDKVVGHLSWCYQRIVVSMPHASATTNNSFWSLGPDGLFDTPGAAPGDDSLALPWLVLPDTWEIRDAVGGGGYVWFPAAADSKSTVYRWKPDSNDVPQPAWELPANELATAVIHYQGQVLVRAAVVHDEEGITPDLAVAARLYRCVLDQSAALVPFLLVQIKEDDPNNGAGAFYAGGRFVFFGWSAMSDDETRSGLGMIDLATSGWCRSLITPPGDGVVKGTVAGAREWRGHLWFAVDGQGVWRTTENRVADGYMETDTVDKGSTLMKFISTIRCVFDPLPTGGRVAVEGSYDRGETWVDFGWERTTAGSQELVVQLNRSVRMFSLRVWLERGTDITRGPKVTITQLQAHQASLVDEMIEWPVDCADVTFSPSGARSDEGQGTGSRRARWLESLAQAEVAVQDVDYPHTAEVGTFQVVGTETRFVARYNEAHGKNEVAQVCVVSLRRPQHRLT